MNITASNVLKVFNDCLFDTQPDTGTEFIGVEGVHANVGFDPHKIEQHKEEITSLLDQLDDKFKENTGGGYSFMSVPFTKDGDQWGEQIDGDRLMMLGMAIGRVKYLLPREMWRILPGSVPYYVITEEEFEVERKVV